MRLHDCQEPAVDAVLERVAQDRGMDLPMRLCNCQGPANEAALERVAQDRGRGGGRRGCACGSRLATCTRCAQVPDMKHRMPPSLSPFPPHPQAAVKTASACCECARCECARCQCARCQCARCECAGLPGPVVSQSNQSMQQPVPKRAKRNAGDLRHCPAARPVPVRANSSHRQHVRRASTNTATDWSLPGALLCAASPFLLQQLQAGTIFDRRPSKKTAMTHSSWFCNG
eukprot:14262-Chlamydomonas_euryale.AAC.4